MEYNAHIYFLLHSDIPQNETSNDYKITIFVPISESLDKIHIIKDKINVHYLQSKLY